MKTLVAYYTRTGHTKKAGDEMAKALGADFEEVIDTRNRSGVLGYINAGRDASLGISAIIRPIAKNPADYDLVIVGTPVWAFTLTPAIRTYLSENRERFKKIAFYCTFDGSGGEPTFRAMEDVSGKTPAATLELTRGEIVNGEYIGKVRDFAEGLNSKPE
ncbi:MAG: flavodoxin [Candidatus Altiarchaeota archaeon]|nr:flavodoxin [Candidatus Altiarchaeota archaeon]